MMSQASLNRQDTIVRKVQYKQSAGRVYPEIYTVTLVERNDLEGLL